MPMPAAIRNLIQQLFDSAEVSPDRQAAVFPLDWAGQRYKVHVDLKEWPDEARIRVVRKPGS